MNYKHLGDISLGRVFQNIKSLFDGLANVAKTGSYNDLKDTPTIVNMNFSVANYTITSDNITEIAIPGTVASLTRLLVFQNGILLTESVHYTLDSGSRKIVLNGYSVSTNDEFVFISF